MYVLYMYYFNVLVIKANANNIIYMQTPTSALHSQTAKIHLFYVTYDLQFNEDFGINKKSMWISASNIPKV